MQMENSSIILLVLSAFVSFLIGRTIMHFRRRKQKSVMEAKQRRDAQAVQDGLSDPESRNRAKRRRQLRQMGKSVNKQ